MEEGLGNRQGQRTNKLQEIFPEVDKGQSRDLVAERVGMGSGKTYEAAKILKAKIEKNSRSGLEGVKVTVRARPIFM